MQCRVRKWRKLIDGNGYLTTNKNCYHFLDPILSILLRDIGIRFPGEYHYNDSIQHLYKPVDGSFLLDGDVHHMKMGLLRARKSNSDIPNWTTVVDFVYDFCLSFEDPPHSNQSPFYSLYSEMMPAAKANYLRAIGRCIPLCWQHRVDYIDMFRCLVINNGNVLINANRWLRGIKKFKPPCYVERIKGQLSGVDYIRAEDAHKLVTHPLPPIIKSIFGSIVKTKGCIFVSLTKLVNSSIVPCRKRKRFLNVCLQNPECKISKTGMSRKKHVVCPVEVCMDLMCR